MFFCIITGRSLLWPITSLVATLLMLAALLSPAWLIGLGKFVTWDNETTVYLPSVGVYTKCGKPMKIAEDRLNGMSCTTLAARGLATDASVFPTAWKAATIFIALGLTIMCITVICGIVSCCFQSIFKKSIFTISGATQVIAGMCYIIGVMLYPMAWGSSRVQTLCGREVSPFYLGDCTIGLGLWMAAAGTALTFATACLSVLADKSTSSDKVQDQIDEGHTLICLP